MLPGFFVSVSHGTSVPVLEPLPSSRTPFTIAQTASPKAARSQPAPTATGAGFSAPPAPPTHSYTFTVLTTPPLVNSETTSRSPSMWLPVKLVVLGPAAGAMQSTAGSCRNQKPTLPSPAFENRSRAKYRIGPLLSS